MAWYRPEQWALLREVAADRDNISETWSEWEATALRSFAVLRARGLNIRKVDVNVREIQEWCERHQRPIDGAARAEFVRDKLGRDLRR